MGKANRGNIQLGLVTLDPRGAAHSVIEAHGVLEILPDRSIVDGVRIENPFRKVSR